LGRSFVSIALIVAALAGCVHEPSPPVSLPAPLAASSEELRWAVEAGLAAHNWTVTKRAPGSITAFVYSRGSGDQATIQVAYRPGLIEIRCLEKKRVSEDRYDRWVRLLSGEIQKSVAMLGMVRRPPAPPPPSPPPPPPPEQ